VNTVNDQIRCCSYWDFDFSHPYNSLDMAEATREA